MRHLDGDSSSETFNSGLYVDQLHMGEFQLCWVTFPFALSCDFATYSSNISYYRPPGHIIIVTSWLVHASSSPFSKLYVSLFPCTSNYILGWTKWRPLFSSKYFPISPWRIDLTLSLTTRALSTYNRM